MAKHAKGGSAADFAGSSSSPVRPAADQGLDAGERAFRGAEDAVGHTGPSHAAASTAHEPALWGSPGAYKVVMVLLGALLAVGLGIMLYPAAQRAFFLYKSVQGANEYQRAVGAYTDAELDEEWRLAQAYNKARVYNRTHRTNTIVDPFSGDEATERINDEYWDLLNPMGNGVMGYIDVPRIGQRLNIYHGTDEDALLKGIGHVQGTSLPVGGESTHCVVSGHRGLPGAKIFTDLDQMQEGDILKFHVLNHHLAYEVDQILVVKPEEIGAIDIVEGEDLVTLITCTPYAVNTHRLLVRGHRVPYVDDDTGLTSLLGWLTPERIALLALAVGAIVVLAVRLCRRRKTRKESPEDHYPAGDRSPTG